MKKIKLLIGITFLMGFNANLIAQWNQLGIDLDGEMASDNSGTVSMNADGTVVIIGAPENDGNGANSGHVRVYEFILGNWAQKGVDIDGAAIGDQFGYSVDINASGDIIAVGGRLNDIGGTSAGHVQVFKYISGNWVQQGADMIGTNANDFTGWSVSLSADGNIVAFGSPGGDGSFSDAGHASVYQFNGTSWNQLGVNINGEAIDDSFGWDVSISANGLKVAISSQENDDNGLDAGHVKVYEWNGASWVQIGLNIDGQSGLDNFGNSINLNADGTILAVGAIGNDGNGTDAGNVRVFQDVSGVWTQLGSDIGGENIGDYFGSAVSLNSSGNILFAGGLNNDGIGTDAGHVRVYEYVSNTWLQIGLDIDGEAAGDRFGDYVCSDSTGSKFIAGGKYNDAGGTNAGYAQVYSKCATTTSSISPSACISYTSPSGNYTWTSSNIYKDTILNAGGCDSIITINLTINQPKSSTDVISACGSYQWIDNNTYTSSNTTATHTIANGAANGCDSVVTLNLTINNASAGTDVVSACGSYQWIDNNIYTSSNTTATHTIANGAANGCDSVVTLNLTINNASTGTDVVSACGSYQWIDNNTYTSSNTTATHTIANGAANGCDSVVTLNLTINNVDTSVTIATTMLTANATGATYQWLDCEKSFAIITGATNQNYTANWNGNYAVEVTENGCTDTSSCYTVIGVGIDENDFGDSFIIYPNPSSGLFTIKLNSISNQMIRLVVEDLSGKQVGVWKSNSSQKTEIDLSQETKGVYLVIMTTSEGPIIKKIVIE
jgi:hypothetical protein